MRFEPRPFRWSFWAMSAVAGQPQGTSALITSWGEKEQVNSVSCPASGMISTSPLMKRYTLDEYFEVVQPDCGPRYDLIDGVLYMLPRTEGPHNFAHGKITVEVCAHVHRQKPGGAVFVSGAGLIYEEKDTYLQPDLMYVSEETIKGTPSLKFKSADLVIETVSPSRADYDYRTKADSYASLGVKELWLVDPEEKLIEVRLQSTADKGYLVSKKYIIGDTFECTILPGLKISVNEIMEAIPPHSS